MPPRPLFELGKIDPDQVVADIENIRSFNPQRYEFEQLSWICHLDEEADEVAGVLEVPEDVWWGRGHVPQRALMPGVLMLESAAQVCSWVVHQRVDAQQHPGRIFGFGGIDGVKFRSALFPPDRLIILGKPIQIGNRRAIFETQGYHGDLQRMIFQARITGLWV